MPSYITTKNSLTRTFTPGRQYVFRVKTTYDGQDYLSDWSDPVAANVTTGATFSNGTTIDIGTGKILYSNVYPTLADLPDAASYHGMFAHVHAEGAAYYAHNGNWVRLADDADVPSSYVSGVNGISGSVTLAAGSNVQIGQLGNQLTISSTQTSTTLNGESGSLSLVGGNGIGVSTADNIITVTATDHTSVNNVTGSVGIVAGENINVTTSGQNVVISGQSGGVSWGNPPTDPGDPGNPGDVAYDDNYLYVHTSQGWRRATLGSWNPAITLTIQPQDLSLGLGQSGNFTVAATVSDGSSPSYQWQNSDDSGATWDTLTGSTGTTYSLSGVSTADNGTQYRAIVSAAGASDVTSSVATLTVTATAETFDLLAENGDTLLTETGDTFDTSIPATITITSQPQNATASGGTASFSVTATVDDSSTLSYQWQEFTGAIWADITGGTSRTLSLGGLTSGDNGDEYRVQVSSSTAATVTSDTAVLTVSTVSSWTQYGADIDGGAAGNDLGPVALNSNGTVMVVGEPGYDSGGLTGNGLVTVYADNGTAWVQRGLSFAGSYDYYPVGQHVKISYDGTTILYTESGNINFGWPKRAVWDGSSLSLSPTTNLKPYKDDGSSVAYESDWEYGAIALSGDGDSVAFLGRSVSNRIYVYDVSGGTWSLRGTSAPITANVIQVSSQFRRSLSLNEDGSVVAAGVAYNNIGYNDPFEHGYVVVYEWTGTYWAQRGANVSGTTYSGFYSSLVGSAYNDQFGQSVSLTSNGNRLAVGAPYGDAGGTDRGYVRVYDWSGTAWSQVGGDITGVSNYDYAGWSVDISSDGSRVVVGLRGADGNGSNSGTTRIYDYNGTAWVQVGGDIEGSAGNDYSGSFVTISGDGTRVGIGAPGNDDGGADAGQVRVFEAS